MAAGAGIVNLALELIDAQAYVPGFAPGAVVAEVARRADIRAGQIYRWRRELGAVVDGFAQVLNAPPELAAEAAVIAEPVIKVEFSGRACVRIPASFPAELAAAVVKALSQR